MEIVFGECRIVICHIEVGMSCNLKIWSMNTCVIVYNWNGCCNAQKWAYLERKSITTLMKYLFPTLPNLTIKSMEMLAYVVATICRDCSCLVASFFYLCFFDTCHIQWLRYKWNSLCRPKKMNTYMFICSMETKVAHYGRWKKFL